jgi:hypothetical protein
MSKLSRFAPMVAIALSWTAVSCMGPAYKPPVADATPASTPAGAASAQAPAAAAHGSSTPILASVTTPGVGAGSPSAAPAAPAPVGAAAPTTLPTTSPASDSLATLSSPWNGSTIYGAGAALAFLCLATSMYVFRGRAPE